MQPRKILYIRVSSINQNTDRQRVNSDEYDLVIEDKCSGTIPFRNREGGKKAALLANEGAMDELHVWQIDRLGRSLIDILETIRFFSQKRVSITFISQGLITMDKDGNENPITKMIISILGTVAEMEKNQIRERQLEGIILAKLKGKYKGRKKGTSESLLDFLQKPINKKALEFLKKGYSIRDTAALTGLHRNTVSKIKKIMSNES